MVLLEVRFNLAQVDGQIKKDEILILKLSGGKMGLILREYIISNPFITSAGPLTTRGEA